VILVSGRTIGDPVPTYGRLAYIHCDDHPAVELLEVVVAEPGGVWKG
jgi:hypothetical protein